MNSRRTCVSDKLFEDFELVKLNKSLQTGSQCKDVANCEIIEGDITTSITSTSNFEGGRPLLSPKSPPLIYT